MKMSAELDVASIPLSIPYMGWELEQVCNLGCEFCYSSSHNMYRRNSIVPKLSNDDLISGLRLLNTLDVGLKYINWTGGEPLIRLAAECRHPGRIQVESRFEDVLRAATKFGLRNILCTNGNFSAFGITRDNFTDFLRRVAGTLDWIAVSLDAVDEQLNDEVIRRPAGNWPRQKGTSPYRDVAHLLNCFRRGEIPQRLKLNTVVSRKNLHHLAEIAKSLGDLPCVWKIIQFNPRECPPDKRREYEITQDEFQFAVDDAKRVLKSLDGLHQDFRVALRTYDGSGEPYCCLISNTRGELFMPIGERHEVLGNIVKVADGTQLLSAGMLRERLWQQLQDTGLAQAGPMDAFEAFSRRNEAIWQRSYGRGLL